MSIYLKHYVIERERDRCPATALFLCHSTSPARCHSKSLHHLVLPPHLSLFFFFFFYCLARMAVCVCVRVIGLWCGMLLGRLHCVAVIHPHSFFFFLFHFFFFFPPVCVIAALYLVLFFFSLLLSSCFLLSFFFFPLSLHTFLFLSLIRKAAPFQTIVLPSFMSVIAVCHLKAQLNSCTRLLCVSGLSTTTHIYVCMSVYVWVRVFAFGCTWCFFFFQQQQQQQKKKCCLRLHIRSCNVRLLTFFLLFLRSR